jgi:hypothetical protein
MSPSNLTKLFDIIEAIRKHIASRSGIDFRNYGDRASAMEDYRTILRHGKDARAMLRAVELSSMPASVLLEAFSAYSGRLTYTEGKGCDYCAGQYYATEYRAAACAVLSLALWQHYGSYEAGMLDRKRAVNWAKRNLGRGIAGRWFR